MTMHQTMHRRWDRSSDAGGFGIQRVRAQNEQWGGAQALAIALLAMLLTACATTRSPSADAAASADKNPSSQRMVVTDVPSPTPRTPAESTAAASPRSPPATPATPPTTAKQPARQAASAVPEVEVAPTDSSAALRSARTSATAETASLNTKQPLIIDGATYGADASGRMRAQRGVASWYGKPFHGRKTASGERYDMHRMSAAHRGLPLPSYALVRHRGNGREVVVRINDRGPYVRGRIIDLSHAAAKKLGIQGLAMVDVIPLVVTNVPTGAPTVAATPLPLTLQR